MKLSWTGVVVTAGLVMAMSAYPAAAQEDLDADGDGMLTLEELQAGYPDLTEEQYASVDADADGIVSMEELQAAIEAGTLVAAE